MWKFITGFVSGVYVGSYYNCKPTINTIKSFVQKNIPEKLPNTESNKDLKN